jgi:excisionase family DNA binding protein
MAKQKSTAWAPLTPSSFRDPSTRELAWARWEATIADLDARGLGDAIGYIPRPSRRREADELGPDVAKIPILLTVAQTAALLGRSVRAVESMIYRNELETCRVGKRARRIKRDPLLRKLGLKGVRRG